MSVQHKDVLDAETHEPKNFTSAATSDSGKVNTPSSTTAGVSVLRQLASDEVTYDNTTSGLTATEVKSALDELQSEKTSATSPVLTTPQINDTSADHQYVVAVNELTADRTVTLPLLTANDVFVFQDFIQTLTNKRITARVSTVASASSIDVDSDSYDQVQCNALAVNTTVNAPTGTPTEGQRLVVRITQDATGSRTITFNAAFVGATAESGTLSTTSTWEFIYDTSRTAWVQVAATVDA